jgi:hypothetical protein
MKRRRGKHYPNGITKSRLYEVFLSFRDFGCTADVYLLDLSLIRQEEAVGRKHCFWYEDDNGRQFVDNLSLINNSYVLLITDDGFKFITMSDKIFISYAKEDADYARKLYRELKDAGASPWLDEEDLFPGKRWEIEIEAQISESDYFIALISSRSVAKRGYVQREIRYALDVLDRIPEKEIYLIPARLDKCEPSHRRLQNIHWVDLYPDWEKGLRKILKSLQLSLA